MSRRVLGWFSCGVTSAVAMKLAAVDYPHLELVYCDTGGEHPDNGRFLQAVANWLNKPVTVLRNPKYTDHIDVVLRDRYVNGPTGARCTLVLKRRLREAYQHPDDLHVFGFDADEGDRVTDFAENNPGLTFTAPLVDAGLTKSDCKNIIERAGIELPVMYKLGYQNNNCIGCVKGGMGYWNKIRVDFPETFARMAAAERVVGAAVLRRKGERLYLDELEPDAGRFSEDQPGECGVLCQAALARVGLDVIPAACGGV